MRLKWSNLRKITRLNFQASVFCLSKIDITSLTVKVVPYTFVRRGVSLREDTYPEPSACEVGWPVPFLVAFISPVFPLGTHLQLGEQ